ncbi:MAG: FliO/MopB family protein [Sedimentisphaerales bacterium]
MTRYKKKIVVFLVTVALVSGGLVTLSTQSARCSMLDNLKFQISNSKFQESSIENELFFKTMLAVLLVIVLGVAAIYTCRKLLPRITNLPGKQIRILETVHLGPRKAVHLIEIGNQLGPCSTGGRRLLVGSTNENITTLADVTDTVAELSAQEVDGSHFATDCKMGTPENDARI